MPDLFDVLEADHIGVQAVLHQLVTSHESEQQAKLAETLVIEESKHEAAEEMHFWPAVRRYLLDGGSTGGRGDLAGAGREAGP